jgi:hypothetical protein
MKIRQHQEQGLQQQQHRQFFSVCFGGEDFLAAFFLIFFEFFLGDKEVLVAFIVFFLSV